MESWSWMRWSVSFKLAAKEGHGPNRISNDSSWGLTPTEMGKFPRKSFARSSWRLWNDFYGFDFAVYSGIFEAHWCKNESIPVKGMQRSKRDEVFKEEWRWETVLSDGEGIINRFESYRKKKWTCVLLCVYRLIKTRIFITKVHNQWRKSMKRLISNLIDPQSWNGPAYCRKLWYRPSQPLFHSEKAVTCKLRECA